MTYNFDPDRWYNNEFEFKKTQYKSGKITEKELKSALKSLKKDMKRCVTDLTELIRFKGIKDEPNSY